MKLLVVLIVFVGSFHLNFALYPEDKENAAILFRAWLMEHKRQYRTQQEFVHRFFVFRENLRYINRLNTQHNDRTVFAINQFADISPEEFETKVLMPKRTPPKFNRDRYMKPMSSDPLPDFFDWTTQGKVTSVKDQGTVGTCWAFSTVGNIEGQWAMAGHQLTNFSVEQIVDCDSTKDIPKGNADCGVFGGWPYLAYQYVNKTGGLERWKDYSYCSGVGGGPGTCFPCAPAGYNKTLCGPPVPYCLKNESCNAKLNKSKFEPGLKVVNWKAISENETEIAQALMKLGPLSVALDAMGLQFYHHGVYEGVFCSKKNLDHAVLLVGFGNKKELFHTVPYWRVKNSWGHKWGMSGYFLIQRGTGACGINTQVTTAVLG